ncbi:hypothetical protein [Paenibacillus donghaensis]|uniref:Uncharacterized protein n=1 Tax=Paenibacillus donghaensis TaxID=414771 RepID=A0A2Z2KAH7_9BACL|nr:hypothetical protein [Paenibacillus donghaensis]ASA19803.1 hypothetical protein B9T62_02655 [Paenibacillus donghaensis]
MNHILAWLRSKRDILLLSGLLLLFVIGLYSINGLFYKIDSKTRLNILPENLVSAPLNLALDSSFRIESATKQSNGFSMYSFWAVDSNSVIFNRMQPSYTGIKLSMLFMDDNEVKDIETNSNLGVGISADRKKIIYTGYESGKNEPEVYSYEWKSGASEKLNQDQAYYRVFVGDNKYISFDGFFFNEVDLTTKKITKLLTLDTIGSEFSHFTENDSLNETIAHPESMTTSEDKNYMYMMIHFGENNEGIYRYSLNGGDSEIFTHAEQIYQYSLYKDESILLLGQVNGTRGLYLYDSQYKQYKLLKKGSFLGFEIDKDGSRIAYMEMLENQRDKNELHVAYLKNDELQSDTVIYRNIQDFNKMSWFENSLFVGGSSLSTSEIYRFTFRMW